MNIKDLNFIMKILLIMFVSIFVIENYRNVDYLNRLIITCLLFYYFREVSLF